MSKKTNHYLNEEDLKNELILVKKTERLKHLSKKETLTDEEIAEKNQLLEEGINPNYKRTKFGEMLLLLINKILTQPKFSSYSYKDEFISNAIEKVFLYGITNFNPDKLSKVNNKPVKAFAYLTQIITNSIIATINAKKAEKELLDTYFTELKDSELYCADGDSKASLKLKANGNVLYADKDYNNEFEDKKKVYVRFVINKNDKSEAIINQYKKDDFRSVLPRPANIKTYDMHIYYMILIPKNSEDDIKISYENVFGADSKFAIVAYEPFNSLEEIVEKIIKMTCKDRLFLDILYPDVYTLKERELNKILSHNISALNIVKFYEKYIPQFPFQRKNTENNINADEIKKEKGLELWV